MESELLIFGTGAHARKVYQCALLMKYTVRAFVDESPAARAPFEGLEVVSPDNARACVGEKACIFVAVGCADVRRRLMDQFLAAGWVLPVLVHPNAYVAPDVKLAEGVLVAAGAVVETGSTIGRGSIIDIGVIVDHDCCIGEFVHLKAGVMCQPGTTI